MLQRILTYVLLISITFESLLPKTIGFSEGMKFGELISHFQEHKEKGIGLVEFLWMHYSQDSEHKKDHQSHKRLPSLESTFFAFSFELPTTNWFENNCQIEISTENLTSFIYKNLYSFQPGFSFLNPPRI